MQRKVHKIDATNKSLGRLASQIAVLLRGKNKVSFQPHLDEGDIVQVENVDKIKITGKKLEQKKYFRSTGKPGSIKTVELKDLIQTKPEQVLQLAVYNMLPKNRLRAKMIKRLHFIK